MLPAALARLQTAQECFDDEYGSLTTGLLTSVTGVALIVGVTVVWHGPGNGPTARCQARMPSGDVEGMRWIR
jgi:hypothetical protein